MPVAAAALRPGTHILQRLVELQQHVHVREPHVVGQYLGELGCRKGCGVIELVGSLARPHAALEVCLRPCRTMDNQQRLDPPDEGYDYAPPLFIELRDTGEEVLLQMGVGRAFDACSPRSSAPLVVAEEARHLLQARPEGLPPECD